jgi:hypothetical protein
MHPQSRGAAEFQIGLDDSERSLWVPVPAAATGPVAVRCRLPGGFGLVAVTAARSIAARCQLTAVIVWSTAALASNC